MTLVFLLGLLVAVGWKIYQLTKNPKNGPLRSVTLCLSCAALSYPLAMPGGASGFDTVAGHGAAKLAQNVLLLATVYFLMCFYLYAAADEEAGKRRARREGVLVVLVAGVITTAALTVPHEVFVGSFATTDMTVPQAAVFYLAAGLYLAYALSAAAVWTRRYARISPRPHSTGLWVAGAGMLGMALACAIRAAIVTIRWQGGSVPGELMAAVAFLLVVSILLFVFGVTYPGVRMRLSTYRLWRQRRHEYERLEPLWTLMTEAAPHAVLETNSLSWHARWQARGVHRRHHRRVVECWDGLVEISPYLAATGPGGYVLHDEGPERIALRLRDAVRARAQDPGAPVPAQSLSSVPRQRDHEADVEELLALSDALRARN